jgi:hypothetical protein
MIRRHEPATRRLRQWPYGAGGQGSHRPTATQPSVSSGKQCTICVPYAYHMRTICAPYAYIPYAYHMRTICVPYAYHMRTKLECVPCAYQIRTKYEPNAFQMRTRCVVCVPDAYQMRTMSTKCVPNAYQMRTKCVSCVPDAYQMCTSGVREASSGPALKVPMGCRIKSRPAESFKFGRPRAIVCCLLLQGRRQRSWAGEQSQCRPTRPE